MDDKEFEFVLFDRIEKIKQINEQYDLEKNAYISFSGGKDSTILHHLIDLALPNNKIPRLFLNTGIEYNDIVNYVKELAKDDDRIIIHNSGANIKQTLEEYGYPFKSKQHSHNFSIYKNNKETINKYINKINNDYKLLKDYNFISNLPKGVKTIIKYIYGIRERERESCISTKNCPEALLYQFDGEFTLNCSDKCCFKLKKQPALKYAKDNNKTITITGIRGEEGGMRNQGGCTIFEGNYLKKFHPLKPINEDFENWFIKHYNIKLCKLYYPPFNFKRTGCKGCPFSLDLQNQLDIMEELLPNEKKQCENIWKPVYDEYRRIGYRLNKKSNQMTIFDFMEE